MPKSKHRKDQKKKSLARTEKLQAQKRKEQLKFKEEFMKQLEKIKDRDLEIKEVGEDELKK